MRPLPSLRRRRPVRALLLWLALGLALPAAAETPPASWTPTVPVPPPEPPPRPENLTPSPAGAQPAPLPPERPPELSAPRAEPAGPDPAKGPESAKAQGPAPSETPAAAAPSEAAGPAATHPLPAAPLPPERPPELTAPPAAPSVPSRDVPLPPERPSELATKPAQEPTAPGAPGAAAPMPPSRPPELSSGPAPGQPVPMPDDTACRRRLERLGVRFAPQEPIVNGQCSVAAPLTVSALGDVALSSAETMTCPVAEALARWTTEAQVAAEKELGDALKGLRLGGGYACRGMNHGPDAQLSEHAFANAVDVMGFTFGKHAPVAVGFLPAGTPEAAFLAAVRAKACGFFRTVLGPGANEAHANHLHFDERDRTRGLRLCE